jgi:hypothetical protein
MKKSLTQLPLRQGSPRRQGCRCQEYERRICDEHLERMRKERAEAAQ